MRSGGRRYSLKRRNFSSKPGPAYLCCVGGGVIILVFRWPNVTGLSSSIASRPASVSRLASASYPPLLRVRVARCSPTRSSRSIVLSLLLNFWLGFFCSFRCCLFTLNVVESFDNRCRNFFAIPAGVNVPGLVVVVGLASPVRSRGSGRMPLPSLRRRGPRKDRPMSLSS